MGHKKQFGLCVAAERNGCQRYWRTPVRAFSVRWHLELQNACCIWRENSHLK